MWSAELHDRPLEKLLKVWNSTSTLERHSPQTSASADLTTVERRLRQVITRRCQPALPPRPRSMSISWWWHSWAIHRTIPSIVHGPKSGCFSSSLGS